ncbi:MAG: nucleoside triphosphate pyrophosphohydrolase [Bdellovibrionota bacterium]
MSTDQPGSRADRSAPAPGAPPDFGRLSPLFERLVGVVARLRAPDGCPWDREQNLSTIKPFTLEETHELLEAIDSGDDSAIVEELGDLLLQVILDAQIGADEGRFNLIQVVEHLADKLVRRHPHVFGDVKAHTPAQVVSNWEALKRAEKQERPSALSGVPVTLPALARACRVSEKSARVGYDWPRREMLFDKLKEEVGELADELFPGGKIPDVPASAEGKILPDEPVRDPARLARIEEELGDVLFVVANIARRWGVNPEEALRKTNRKFERRFHYIEQALARQGKKITDVSLEEMEALYQEGRKTEKK